MQHLGPRGTSPFAGVAARDPRDPWSRSRREANLDRLDAVTREVIKDRLRVEITQIAVLSKKGASRACGQ